MLPEYNDYTNYGDVVFVLDEHTFDGWVAYGSRGTGFVVSPDNEIVVTSSNFSLTGIPRSRNANMMRAIGVRYYSDNDFVERTGFNVEMNTSDGK